MAHSFRKGQSAVEYVSTYGWALIMLLAVIAVLFASGIFAPSRFITPDCSFQPDIPCSSYIIQYTGPNSAQLKLNLTNALGFPIYITSITASSDYLGVANTPVLLPASTVLQQGDPVLVTATFPNGKSIVRGTITNVNITMVYRNCATAASLSQCPTGGSAHSVSGKVTAPIE